jgi:hypothetical protein
MAQGAVVVDDGGHIRLIDILGHEVDWSQQLTYSVAGERFPDLAEAGIFRATFLNKRMLDVTILNAKGAVLHGPIAQAERVSVATKNKGSLTFVQEGNSVVITPSSTMLELNVTFPPIPPFYVYLLPDSGSDEFIDIDDFRYKATGAAGTLKLSINFI